jgi:hypothetical protein
VLRQPAVTADGAFGAREGIAARPRPACTERVLLALSGRGDGTTPHGRVLLPEACVSDRVQAPIAARDHLAQRYAAFSSTALVTPSASSGRQRPGSRRLGGGSRRGFRLAASNRRTEFIQAMPNDSELAQEIGRRLHKARLVRGEDLAQAARARLIPASYLAALEQGAFQQIPGRSYTAALVRAYGDHLGLDGAKLAEPLRVATASLPPPGPNARGQTSGSQRHAAATIAVFLLLTVAASVTYYALHRLRPGTIEAVLSTVDQKARDWAKWIADTPLAAGPPATIPSSASAAAADKAVGTDPG